MYECNRYSKINKRGVSPTKNNLKKKININCVGREGVGLP